MVNVSCKQCGGIFRDYESNHRVYCSMDCRNISKIRHKRLNCIGCGKKLDRWYVKMCFGCWKVKLQTRTGESHPRYKVKPICIDCGKNVMSRKAIRCGKCMNEYRRTLTREKSPNWQGGKTSLSTRIRNSKEYILWRTAVFLRDDYTCQKCNKHGGYLEVDHIKPFAFFPELRFAIDNGRTLCVPCHRQTDTYGQKAVLYERRNN